jgi:hypothetical protein
MPMLTFSSCSTLMFEEKINLFIKRIILLFCINFNQTYCIIYHFYIFIIIYLLQVVWLLWYIQTLCRPYWWLVAVLLWWQWVSIYCISLFISCIMCLHVYVQGCFFLNFFICLLFCFVLSCCCLCCCCFGSGVTGNICTLYSYSKLYFYVLSI